MFRAKNFDLYKLNTFRVHAQAKNFVRIDSLDEFISISRNFSFWQPNFLILGKGSNILFVDNFPGTVVQFNFSGIEILSNGSDVMVKVYAGEVWDNFVAWAVNHGFSGIENLSGIPGTVGGAIVQNIGAYGQELSSVVEAVGVYNIKLQKVQVFKNSQCKFTYRDSYFKHNSNLVVLWGIFRLSKEFVPNLSYAGLQTLRNVSNLTPREVRKQVLNLRATKLPNWQKEPNAGSFFKNPIVNKKLFKAVQAKYPTIPFIELKGEPKQYKISAGWLIDKAGLKGYKLGKAYVSSKHALVLVNSGDPTGKDVLELASFVKQTVYKNFNINLEPEVRIYKQGKLYNL